MQMASGPCLMAPIEDNRLQGKIVEHSNAVSGQAAIGGSGHREAVQRTAATSLKQSPMGRLSTTAPGRLLPVHMEHRCAHAPPGPEHLNQN